MRWRQASGLAVLASGLLVGVTRAAAQPADELHEHAANIGVGGELTAAVSPPDRSAYFNYTDYDLNALRIARLRLFGEWRPAAPLAFVAEFRSENVVDVTVAALYGRWRPFAAHELYVEAGRIPPVIGSFGRHAYGRDNLVNGQPLAYQYLTSLRPDALPETVNDLIRMRGRGWQPSYPVGARTTRTGIPLIAGGRWDTGVSALWRIRWLEAATAFTRGSPALPVVQDTNSGHMWSGRMGARLPHGVSIGISGARGQWIEQNVLTLIPNGEQRHSSQSVIGMDAEIGLGRWLVREELWHADFDLPLASEPTDLRLHAWSGFVEGRYRFHPRWQAALRVERLRFSHVTPTGAGNTVSWDADVDRVETVLGFRASRRAEVRGGWQHNWRNGGRVRERGYPTIGLIYWF